MKLSQYNKFLFQTGMLDIVHKLWANRLTVLAYHRIDNPHLPEFDTFKPNVSATPADFSAQMDYLCRHFNVVSNAQVVAWLQGEQSLPPRPALITFDDGYFDNFKYALPVLQARNLPAIVFLATDYIGQKRPFFWDLTAYCFHHTRCTRANLPHIGIQHWDNVPGRTAVMNRWLAVLKTLPDADKWAAIDQLPQALGVTVPNDAFAGLCMSWDQVRMMAANGVEMGAHTQSHPILTRVSLAQARAEVQGSKARIEAELGQAVTSFAYPNGQPADFSPALQTLVADIGLHAAFTLLPGPTSMTAARRSPMAIRRIFIGHRDTLPRFAAKLAGLFRLAYWRR